MSWLSPPRPSDDEAARVARTIHVIGLATIIALVIAVIHNVADGRRLASIVLLVELGLVAGSLVLNRRGSTWIAARLLACSFILMAGALQMLDNYGVHDVAVLVYPGAIILAGALLDTRWFVVCALLAMVTLGLQYGIELAGLATYLTSGYTNVRQLIDSEAILAVSSLGVGLLMNGLRKSVARAQAAAASLRESENLYRSLFASVTEAIFVHDPKDGRILDTNPRASEWYGYSAEELRGLSVADLSAPAAGFSQDEAMRRLTATAQGRPQVFEWQARARDGRLFWVEVSLHAAVIGGEPRVLASLRDIDERKRAAAEKQRLEEQLRQAQKLESIGRLAGGVAHDFNNLLTCVLGNVDLAMTITSPSHPIVENLEEIRHAARRSAELTSQLLAFSRKQPIAPISLDLKNVLGSIDRMLRRLLGETVDLRTEVPEDVGRIRADPGQIEQVLVNLAVNARDAMPEGGKLRITTENANLDDAFCAAHACARIGAFVRISVSDTGTGMTTDVQQHIFEPFFTTKPQGKGTGLGLAMVFGAMEQNRGFIILESESGRGTTFNLYFPRDLGEAEDRTNEPRFGTLPRGHERVLLVEDDALVRGLGERVLSQLGYQVVACESGAKAVALGQSGSRDFDVLVTDIILPDMDGRLLARQLWNARPALRVLYCSGYAEDAITKHGVADDGLDFLAKPFTAEALARKVRAVLDEPAAPAQRC
jgi:two-component system cell cycle sensor histidine kinase/response regulator CckA